MRIKAILLVTLIAFLMNGCLADRLKQRIYYLKMRDKNGKIYTKKVVKRVRVETTKSKKASSVKRFYAPKRVKKELYMPSVINTTQVVSEVEEVPLESSPVIDTKSYSTSKKRTVHKVKKKVKKKTKKKRRKVIKKVKKHVKKKIVEPYSLESETSDPELLGPQTTIDANPLSEKKNKI